MSVEQKEYSLTIMLGYHDQSQKSTIAEPKTKRYIKLSNLTNDILA
jgi:hypothetical protein